MFSRTGNGYDQSVSMFSPDGRLFQVEYAIEAVRRGTTAIALRNADSVIFAVEKRGSNPLQERLGSEKIFKIDGHIGAAIAGLTADARALIDQARIQAQVNILNYDEKISVVDVTREICDQAQQYTQIGGRRPYGVSLLIGGIDPKGEPKIFMTDPSGAFWGYYSCAIGQAQQNARTFLEENYKKNMKFEDMLKLAVKTIKQVTEVELSEELFEVAYIRKENLDLITLSTEEKQKLLKGI